MKSCNNKSKGVATVVGKDPIYYTGHIFHYIILLLVYARYDIIVLENKMDCQAWINIYIYIHNLASS